MMKFNGERWELFGPILEDTGPRARTSFDERSAALVAADFYFGISPNVFPTGSTA